MRIVTVAQMRAIETEAEARYGLNGPRLMAVAGASAAQIAHAWRGGTITGTRWLMLIGPGNNGSDGRVMARHLADAGAMVTFFDWATRRLEYPYGRFSPVPTPDDDIVRVLDETDVVVDALLGIGVSRPLGPEMQALNRLVRDARFRRRNAPQIIAIDLPSGMNADSGAVSEGTLCADLTITLACPKLGQFFYPGAAYCGALRVGGIGLPDDMELPGVAEMITPDMARDLVPERPAESNKGTYGKALIVAGSPRFPGAAVLASTACARSGTGLVTIATTPDLARNYVAAIPEAVYALLPETPDERAATLQDALTGQDATLIGPGLDQQPGTTEWFLATLAYLRGMPERERPKLIVDADGLNLLSKLPKWWKLLPPETVLTPHPGEFKRLLGDTALPDTGPERLQTVRDHARKWGHVVILKGAITLIAAPNGEHQERPWFHHAPNPAMATAGTGDVLAGTIAGLLAQGMAPFPAAALGAVLHSRAGRLVADALGGGEAGLLAIDVAHQLPQARSLVAQGA